jgi:hypothetical protein
LRQSLLIPVLAVFSSLVVRAAAPPPPAAPSPAGEIVDHYLSAVQAQQQRSQPLSMEVDIDASLPRLKKQGKLHAFRFITRLGRIFYDKPDYVGDNTVKKEVIARYLQAESQARTDYAGSLAITPENYRFKYRGTTDYAGRTAYVLQVQPRKKRVGLFRGELWVDKATYLPLREWGELVKNPSVFLKSVYFVRDYMIWDGISVPRRLISDVDTRLVGRAQLTVWFENVKVGDQAPQSAGGGMESRVALADGADR